MVWIKNSLTLKAYWDRATTFPIICTEDYYYLQHFHHRDPDAIVESFENFYGLVSDAAEDWSIFQLPQYHVVLNYVILILLDLTAIASVTDLILSTKGLVETITKAIPFVIAIIVGVVSSTIIIIVHDYPLIHERKIRKKGWFNFASILQALVSIFWLVTLGYMIYLVINLHCTNSCLSVQDSMNNCTTFTDCNNNTYPFTMNSTCVDGHCHQDRCDQIQTVDSCKSSNVSVIDCILLAMVLFEGIVEGTRIFFKSFIYPIKIPVYVMFMSFWKSGERDKIVLAVGKMEFGRHWTMDDLQQGESFMSDNDHTVLDQ